ncbi:MAG: hypothetical protein RL156_1402 [Bacteroidota bacterium]|jgi:hypothetical protein
MEKLIFITSVVVGTITVVIVSSIVRAMMRRARTVKRLREAEWARPHKKMNHDIVASLPRPVQAFLEHVINPGVEQARFVTVKQHGQWRSLAQPEWSELRAMAYYSGTIPGFVWHAKMKNSAFSWQDAQLLYGSGEAAGRVKFLGMITMFDPDGQEVASALLARILMECIWFPTSLIPGGQLRWEAVNGNSARAILSDHGTTVSCVYTFNDNNEVTKIVTQDKFRDAETSFEREQCTMYCSDYKQFGGVRIPTKVRLEWNLEEQDFEYARIEIEWADHE